MLKRLSILRRPHGAEVGNMPTRDERGSLIVSLSIIMVVFLLGSVLAARVIGNALLVVSRQNATNSVASADAGLADALFRLDQGPTTSQFCVNTTSTGAQDPACVAASVPGAPGVSYNATTVPANTTPAQATSWLIQAKGTVRGQKGAVQEKVTRSTIYPFALFGNTSLNFNGGTAGFSTYNPGATAVNPASSSNPVYVGSNGTIACNGGVAPGVVAQYYSRGGTTGGCGSPVTQLYNLPNTQPPGGTYTCPGGGLIGSANNLQHIGATGVTTTYVCTDTTVNINGTLTVDGPVKFYIYLNSSTNTALANSGTPTVFIGGGSAVNMPNDGTLPDATLLKIYSNSIGTFGNYNGNGAYTIGAIIDAPGASLTGDGCKSSYYGAVIINIYTCNGGGQGNHLSFSYDNLLSAVYGNWTPAAYLQVPPGAVSIP